MGLSSPSRPRGARGAAAAAAALGLGSVSRAAPGSAAAAAGRREPRAAPHGELGRGAPAPPRRHGPPPRATAGTSRRNPRASSRPSLSDPRVLRRPLPPPYFFPLLSPPLPLQLSVMATEPPSPLRLEAPGLPEMRTPLASETAPEGTPKPAGGRLRFLNGCVPLSHQVAGHMYGKDKVGKWGWRGARRSLSAFARPRPAEAPGVLSDWAGRLCWGARRTLGLFRFPPEPRDPCSRGSKSGAISGIWGVRPAVGGGERGVSGLPGEGGY